MKNMRSLLCASTMILALSGCDNKSDNPKDHAENRPSLADIAAERNTAAPPSPEAVPPQIAAPTPAPMPEASPLPVADKTTPSDKYVLLDSGNQVMFYYYAALGTAIDYPHVLARYSPDYNRTSDEFKKHDLLSSLKPKIDSEIARAKAMPYIKLEIGNPIGQYDFEEKGFPLDSSIWQAGAMRYFSDNSEYNLEFSNGNDFRYIRTPSEDAARKIEALRSKYEAMKVMLYCFVQDADPAAKSVKAQIVKIELIDRKGAVLAINP